MTVVSSPTKTMSNPSFRTAIARVQHTLRADRPVRSVPAPTAGASISRDGHTAIVQAGAAHDANGMVKAADRLDGKLAALTFAVVRVSLTGASAMWSDLNAANRSAMLKPEVICWTVTVLILLVAFGLLVAAGLRLMVTTVGLPAAAGSP
jgi:putative drug exporter of the RND superfamily